MQNKKQDEGNTNLLLTSPQRTGNPTNIKNRGPEKAQTGLPMLYKAHFQAYNLTGEELNINPNGI